MERDFLSDVELYFSERVSETSRKIYLSGDEARHIVKVMRHNEGDEIFVTAGKGKIFRTIITGIAKDEIIAEIKEEKDYENKFENIILAIPIMKNFDRLEFALEKSVELGITRFVVFRAKKSGPKNPKLERWRKILTAAMKQSLRSYLPEISFIENISELKNEKILFFDQNAEIKISDWLTKNEERNFREKMFFVFGPEGGLTENEMNGFSNSEKLRLTENRLRTETAVITLVVSLNSSV